MTSNETDRQESPDESPVLAYRRSADDPGLSGSEVVIATIAAILALVFTSLTVFLTVAAVADARGSSSSGLAGIFVFLATVFLIGALITGRVAWERFARRPWRNHLLK